MDREQRQPSGLRGQSSVLGVVLLLGLTLTAASTVVVLGSVALEDGRQESQIGQAEQAMTQFDSRTAQVALGDSEVQTIQVGRGDGTYRVDENAGRIRLYHENWNKSNATNHEEDIYEENLGAVVYERGDTTIAYQGGGVWRNDSNGGSTMVSPPELHNRKATLTLPIVRVKGNGSGSGTGHARVESVTKSRPIFPDIDGETKDLDDQYNSSTDVIYENPVSSGNMTVEIESNYCRAWRSYLVTRTEGRVSDCDDGVVTAQIVALGAQGDFDIAGSNDLSVRGVNDLDEFTIRMEESTRGSSSFNRLDWEMSADEDGEEFAVRFEGSSPVDCGESVYGEVYFSNSSVTHKWTNDTAFTLDGPDCPSDDDNLYLEVDLLNDSILMNGQSDEMTLGNNTYNASNPAPLGELIEYYFEYMGSMDMDIEEGNNAFISDTSAGNIQYEGGGKVVTFLHVTENEVEVEFN